MFDKEVQPRRVAVIGGGPAGMEFAKIARLRGHSVTLYEKSGALGGMIKHADYASFKWPLRQFKDYLIRQMDELGVDVRLNTEPTPEQIRAEDYDFLALAAGARPFAPPIPGKDLPNVQYGTDAYDNSASLGKHIAVIGGGEVGVETALWLCELGKEVTVLEMLPELIMDAPHAHYKNMVHNYWLRQPNFHSLTGVKCTSIDPDGVNYENPDGTTGKVFADNVLMCVGNRSELDVAMRFAGTAREMCVIGDNDRFANVQKAVREGYAAAMRIH